MIHELAHIWLGASALSDAAMAVDRGITEELWCNQVAAEVLVPLTTLRTDYRGETSIEELERLARKYRVSTLVVLKRIFDARFLSWSDYQARYEEERARVINFLAARRSKEGGGNSLLHSTDPAQPSVRPSCDRKYLRRLHYLPRRLSFARHEEARDL